MEKPSASIIVKAPTKDSGIATIGMTTDRTESRNRNTTILTITRASTNVRATSRIAACTKFVES